MEFKIGDWVKGNTDQGELIHGYVGSLNVSKHTVGIHVVASDHEEAIGQLVEIQDQSVKKLARAPIDQEEQIKSLIDLALSSRDEEWFLELSTKLRSLQRKQANRTIREKGRSNQVSKNRLGYGSL